MERKISDVEHKLTVLYTLKSIGDITQLQLLEYMVENAFMDYVTLQLVLYELEASGQVEKSIHPLGALYHITIKGSETLSLFVKRLPQSKQQSIANGAMAWRSRFAKEKQRIADCHPLGALGCQLEMKIQQGDEWLFFMTLLLADDATAHRFAINYQQRADAIYTTVFSALSEGYEPLERLQANFPACAERVSGKPQWLSLTQKEERMITCCIVLPVPDDDLACHFAEVFSKKSHALVQAVSQILCQR